MKAAYWVAAGCAAVVLCAPGTVQGQAPAPAKKVQGSSFGAPAVKSTPMPTPQSPAAAPGIRGAATPSSAGLQAEATPAPAVVSGAPAAAAPSGPSVPGKYEKLNFDVLSSYKFVEPTPAAGSKPGDGPPPLIPNQIPKNVLAYNGRNVEVEGYMVPMDVSDDGQVKTFILAKTQPECCFGDTQGANEWIDVKLKPGTKAEFIMDRSIKVSGTLEVGEKLEDGYLASLYRLLAEKVSE